MDGLKDRIAQIRKDSGDNLTDAAGRVGISRQGYAKWETGDTANMQLDHFLRFCDRYKVKVEDVLRGTVYESRSNGAVDGVREDSATYVTGFVVIDEAHQTFAPEIRAFAKLMAESDEATREMMRRMIGFASTPTTTEIPGGRKKFKVSTSSRDSGKESTSS